MLRRGFSAVSFNVRRFSTEEGLNRRKLFVGGLSWNVTNDGLQEAFGRFGRVLRANVIMDRETGRSRGYGFVTFAEEEPAAAAVQEMDGAQIDGRTVRISFARVRPMDTPNN